MTSEDIKKAWALPAAAAVRAAGGLEYQAGRTACGPATLVNAARSLGLKQISQANALAGTRWSGDGLRSGMTVDALAELARQRLGWNATTLRGLSLRELRRHLKLSNEPGRRYAVNFHRAPLFGTGRGHHSLLGGYLETEDLALVLDVNGSYGPWLVSSARLHEAIDTTDPESGARRGLLLLDGGGRTEEPRQEGGDQC